MIRDRVVTATILVVAFVALLYFAPPVVWAATCVVVAGAAAQEWGRLASLGRLHLSIFSAVVILFSSGIAIYGSSKAYLLIAGLGSAFWILVAPFWLRDRAAMQAKHRVVIAGLAVLPATCVALISLHQINPNALLGVMAIIWISDTVAFFAGRRFGRRKLASTISPGKSWEGVWFAFAAVIIYACAWWRFSPETLPALLSNAPGSLGFTIALWAIIAALGVVGDLLESQLKRIAGVKDSGNCLPGHGGILDRVDALTAALPFAACIYLIT